MGKRMHAKDKLTFTPVLRRRRSFRENFDAAVKASWKVVQIETPHTFTFKLTKRRG